MLLLPSPRHPSIATYMKYYRSCFTDHWLPLCFSFSFSPLSGSLCRLPNTFLKSGAWMKTLNPCHVDNSPSLTLKGGDQLKRVWNSWLQGLSSQSTSRLIGLVLVPLYVSWLFIPTSLQDFVPLFWSSVLSDFFFFISVLPGTQWNFQPVVSGYSSM